MEEGLVSYEAAVLAKEKGFTLNSTIYYQIFKEGQLRYKLIDDEESYVNADPANRIAVCTQSLLQKWLREVHNIAVIVDFNDNNITYYYFIHTNTSKSYSNRICSLPEIWSTYEDALEVALREALKLIK